MLMFSGDDENKLGIATKNGAGNGAVVVNGIFGEQFASVSANFALPDTPQRTVTLRIDEMTCESCVQAVPTSLDIVQSVSDVSNSLETETSRLSYTSPDISSLLIGVPSKENHASPFHFDVFRKPL